MTVDIDGHRWSLYILLAIGVGCVVYVGAVTALTEHLDHGWALALFWVLVVGGLVGLWCLASWNAGLFFLVAGVLAVLWVIANTTVGR